jgi:hypothetical protein
MVARFSYYFVPKAILFVAVVIPGVSAPMACRRAVRPASITSRNDGLDSIRRQEARTYAYVIRLIKRRAEALWREPGL